MEISFHTTADWRRTLQSHFNQEDRNPWHFRTWDSARRAPQSPSLPERPLQRRDLEGKCVRAGQ